MKKILISIKPEWVEKILNGEKTIEIRKTKPNEDNLPCEVFIYCSEGKKDYHLCKLYKDNKYPYYTYESYKGWGCMPEPMEGKVVAKFTLNNVTKFCKEDRSENNYSAIRKVIYDKDSNSELQYLITSNEADNQNNNWLCKQSCLDYLDIINYVGKGEKYFYGWNIDNLQIFDKSFDLRDDGFLGKPKTKLRITKAPQSWCYCEYDENNGFLPF